MMTFVECVFSKVSTESRLLTAEDVEYLGLDERLIGTSAKIETSIHGIAWLPA